MQLRQNKTKSKNSKSSKIKKKIPLDDLNWGFFSEEAADLKDPITRQITIIPVKPVSEHKLKSIEKGALRQHISHALARAGRANHPLNDALSLDEKKLDDYVVDMIYINKRNNFLISQGYSEKEFLSYRNVNPREYTSLLNFGKSPSILIKILNRAGKIAPILLLIVTDLCLQHWLNLDSDTFLPRPTCNPKARNFLLSERALENITRGNNSFLISPINNCIQNLGTILFNKKNYRLPGFQYSLDTIDFNPSFGFNNATFPELIRNNYQIKPISYIRFPGWVRNLVGLLGLLISSNVEEENFFAVPVLYFFIRFAEVFPMGGVANVNSILLTLNNVCNQINITYINNNQTLAYNSSICHEEKSFFKSYTEAMTLFLLNVSIPVLQFFIAQLSHRAIKKITDFFAPKVPANYWDRETKPAPSSEKVSKAKSHRCVIM